MNKPLTAVQRIQLLKLLRDMKPIDAVQCSREFQRVHGERIDWHEFAYYLSYLHGKGVLEVSKFGSFMQYRVAAPTPYLIVDLYDESRLIEDTPANRELVEAFRIQNEKLIHNEIRTTDYLYFSDYMDREGVQLLPFTRVDLSTVS